MMFYSFQENARLSFLDDTKIWEIPWFNQANFWFWSKATYLAFFISAPKQLAASQKAALWQIIL